MCWPLPFAIIFDTRTFKTENEGRDDHEVQTNGSVLEGFARWLRLPTDVGGPEMTEDPDPTDDTRRDDSAWHRDGFPTWDTDERALRAARNEARESLAETIDSIRRIDDAATKTLRIDLVVLGLSLTAVSALGPTPKLVNELTLSGFAAISLSALVAVVATFGFDYPTGVSEEYIEEFQRVSWSEREWNAWMVQEYSTWLSEANEVADGNARVLLYSQALLAAGLFLLVLGMVVRTAGSVSLSGWLSLLHI